MSSPAEDIALFLENEGVGTRGTNIFVGREPEISALSITLINSGGLAPNPKWLRDYPSVQIRLRSTVYGYSAAWDKANDIKDALLGEPTTTLNSKNYVQFLQLGDILDLGPDANNRALISMNFRFAVERTSGGNREAL